VFDLFGRKVNAVLKATEMLFGQAMLFETYVRRSLKREETYVRMRLNLGPSHGRDGSYRRPQVPSVSAHGETSHGSFIGPYSPLATEECLATKHT
jgi:hypothetical protein